MPQPKRYYICPDEQGNWALHRKGCLAIDETKSKVFVGSLYTDHQAIAVAKIHKPRAVSCTICTRYPKAVKPLYPLH